MNKKQTSLARVGYSFHPWGYDTLPKQKVTYLNVDIVYQEVYHLADQGFIILSASYCFLIRGECSISIDHKLFVPARPILIEKCLINQHVHPVLQLLMRCILQC